MKAKSIYGLYGKNIKITRFLLLFHSKTFNRMGIIEQIRKVCTGHSRRYATNKVRLPWLCRYLFKSNHFFSHLHINGMYIYGIEKKISGGQLVTLLVRSFGPSRQATYSAGINSRSNRVAISRNHKSPAILLLCR